MEHVKRRNMKRILLGLLGVGIVIGLAACDDPQSQAGDLANNNSNSVYVSKNNVEFRNYNDRLKIADDLSTILWCTAYPTNPNVRPLTFPIVGKLTSSGRSPAGNDPYGMSGNSVDYRYGFTPAHVYVDFTGVETVCTTQPTVYQATQTDIVLKIDPGCDAAATAARAALKSGNTSLAESTLENAAACSQGTK